MALRATHTHRQEGGRYQMVAQHEGSGALAGQHLVIYRDMDKDVSSGTTLEDWRQHWRPIAKDDCTVCLGSGTDQIKGNKHKPCGGCFGLGKVREDGEVPESEWQVADVARAVIQRQHQRIGELEQMIAYPGVQELVAKAKAEAMDDAIAKDEHRWRSGKGHGPGGRRHTGD